MMSRFNPADKHTRAASRVPCLRSLGVWRACDAVRANEVALTKFEVVLNLKPANALGLDVPDKLLALADEVMSKDIYLPRCVSRLLALSTMGAEALRRRRSRGRVFFRDQSSRR